MRPVFESVVERSQPRAAVAEPQHESTRRASSLPTRDSLVYGAVSVASSRRRVSKSWSPSRRLRPIDWSYQRTLARFSCATRRARRLWRRPPRLVRNGLARSDGRSVRDWPGSSPDQTPGYLGPSLTPGMLSRRQTPVHPRSRTHASRRNGHARGWLILTRNCHPPHGGRPNPFPCLRSWVCAKRGRSSRTHPRSRDGDPRTSAANWPPCIKRYVVGTGVPQQPMEIFRPSDLAD